MSPFVPENRKWAAIVITIGGQLAAYGRFATRLEARDSIKKWREEHPTDANHFRSWIGRQYPYE